MVWLATLLAMITGVVRSRTALQIENLALRHQPGVYHRTRRRPRIRTRDRIFWSWLSRIWSDWRESLVIDQPERVIAWRRRRFRDYWVRLSRTGKPGRPAVPREIRDLIRRMSTANPLWGAPRIVGELAKIGIHLPKSTVAKYMVRQRKPPSATWRAFLKNHVKEIIAVDFFVVPTVLRRILTCYFAYYHPWRCHQSLEMDCPDGRGVQSAGQGPWSRSSTWAVCITTTNERRPGSEARRLPSCPCGPASVASACPHCSSPALPSCEPATCSATIEAE